jgi:tetratricopeptide (TPR) repeat protein
MKQVALVLACVLSVGSIACAFAEPYLPKSRSDVIYEAKAEWDAALVRPGPGSQNPDEAAATAARFVSQGERSDDPRFYGYARAALKPWKDDPSPPRKVLEQRVRIAQSLHDFDAALADIQRMLHKQPNDVNALLSASLIHQDAGRFDTAKATCDRVALSSHAHWTLCAADLSSVTGGADEAYALLEQNVAQLRDLRTQAWASGLLAQIADRRGSRELAIANFERSLQLAPDAVPLRKSYLNFLYENRHAVRMNALLTNATEDGPYFFHVCLLKKLQGAAGTSRCLDALTKKYQHAANRGDKPHYFEEIVVALDFSNDPAHAFELALQNWNVNKKPSDAVLLAKASVATKNKDVLLSLSSWKRETKLEDTRLDRLLSKP